MLILYVASIHPSVTSANQGWHVLRLHRHSIDLGIDLRNRLALVTGHWSLDQSVLLVDVSGAGSISILRDPLHRALQSLLGIALDSLFGSQTNDQDQHHTLIL